MNLPKYTDHPDNHNPHSSLAMHQTLGPNSFPICIPTSTKINLGEKKSHQNFQKKCLRELTKSALNLNIDAV
jgi:hypothetical protein